jgi:hypothetical protein
LPFLGKASLWTIVESATLPACKKHSVQILKKSKCIVATITDVIFSSIPNSLSGSVSCPFSRISALFRTRTSLTIYKLYRNEDGMGLPWQYLLTSTEIYYIDKKKCFESNLI